MVSDVEQADTRRYCESPRERDNQYRLVLTESVTSPKCRACLVFVGCLTRSIGIVPDFIPDIVVESDGAFRVGIRPSGHGVSCVLHDGSVTINKWSADQISLH
jgi:hypothetical protein